MQCFRCGPADRDAFDAQLQASTNLPRHSAPYTQHGSQYLRVDTRRGTIRSNAENDAFSTPAPQRNDLSASRRADGPPSTSGAQDRPMSKVQLVSQSVWNALDYGGQELREETVNPTNPVAACLVVPNELEIAAGSPGGERVNSLLKRGADPNEGAIVGPAGLLARFTPLGNAARLGNLQAVKDLLSAGASPYWGTSMGPWGLLAHARPMWHACFRDHLEAAEELLRYGADPNKGLTIGPFGLLGSYTPLEAAASAGAQHSSAAPASPRSLCPGALAPPSPSNPLSLICRVPPHSSLPGDVDLVHLLLASGANPNIDSSQGPSFGWWQAKYRPIWHAAYGRHQAALEALLRAGASPNAGLAVGPFGIVAYLTPLELAAVQGDAAAVTAMLRAGANPNALSSIGPFGLLAHTSALGRAAAAGHATVVEQLLKAGAKPDVGSSTGPFAAFTANTPLWDAAAAGHAETVQALLRYGADANGGFALGPGGLFGRHSPVEYAAFLGHSEVLAALTRAGAKQPAAPEGASGLGLLKYLACTDQFATSVAQQQGTFVAAMTEKVVQMSGNKGPTSPLLAANSGSRRGVPPATV